MSLSLPGIVTVNPPAVPRAILVPVAGPQGAQGPAGGTSITALAGTALSGHRLVSKRPDGAVVYVDNTTLADIAKPFWLTLTSASSGAEVFIQSLGVVDEPSWSWTPGPLYLGITGLITQTVPTSPAVFLTQIGYATSPTSIVLDRQPSIRLI